MKLILPRSKVQLLSAPVSSGLKPFEVQVAGSTIIYSAPNPAGAAKKAYYAWARKQTKTPYTLSDTERNELIAHIQSTDATKESKQLYTSKLSSLTFPVPTTVLVKSQLTKGVFPYIASYKLSTKPNKHQIEKGIYTYTVTESSK